MKNKIRKRQGLLKALSFYIALTLLTAACAAASNMDVDVTALYNKIKAGKKIIIIDVRTDEEYNGALGHIKGSILIPLHTLNNSIIKFSAFKSKKIYLICRSGNRSKIAQNILGRAGIKNLYNVLGGMKAWNKASYPIKRD